MGNFDSFVTRMPPHDAPRTDTVQHAAILRLAHATIGLSKVAPRLSELAATRQAEAERQAERVRDIAGMAQEMSATLGNTVRQLQLSSGEIGELTDLIRRIADETRLIAFNTGIAAARAGADGRVFTVLAREIRALSEKTTDATRDVQAKVGRLQESTLRTSTAVGLECEDAGAADADDTGLAWLLKRMDEASSSATQQATEARELNTLGKSLRELSEQMIGSVGAFRLDAHSRVEQLIEELRADANMRSGDAGRQTQVLRDAVDRCRFVELAYATNGRGIQVTENISRTAFRAAYGASGLHRNWSQRPWFLGALRSRGVCLSEIYRSAATDEFCLTASAAFRGEGGDLRGVVALDVNFSEILAT
jgi:hypothetical protein